MSIHLLKEIEDTVNWIATHFEKKKTSLIFHKFQVKFRYYILLPWKTQLRAILKQKPQNRWLEYVSN